MKKVLKMKIKRKVTKDEFNALSEDLKLLYVEKGDAYVLDIEDNAFESIKAENASLKKKLEDLENEKEAKARESEKAREKRDKKDLENKKEAKQWEDYASALEVKLEKLETAKNDTEAHYKNILTSQAIKSEADAICNELSTAPTLLRPYVLDHLTAEIINGEVRIYVKDDSGQKSATSLKEFRQSIVDNAEFSAIIKQTATSGASTQTNNQFSGTKPNTNVGIQAPQQGDQSVNILEMNSEQAAAFAKQIESEL